MGIACYYKHYKESLSLLTFLAHMRSWYLNIIRYIAKIIALLIVFAAAL